MKETDWRRENFWMSKDYVNKKGILLKSTFDNQLFSSHLMNNFQQTLTSPIIKNRVNKWEYKGRIYEIFYLNDFADGVMRCGAYGKF